MSHSFVNCLIHLVFSTKHRDKILSPEMQERLWPYLAGIAQAHGMRALAIGGTHDHVHVLVSIPSTLTLAQAAQEFKGASSKWINDTFAIPGGFSWQQGYGAFSLGISQAEKTVAYINGQREHHRKRTFQEELVAFLRAHEMEYNEKYL